MIPSISVKQLQQRLAQTTTSEQPLLLDVREPKEYALCHIQGAKHIPLGEIGVRLGELDPEQEIIVICHHGMRSLQAAMQLAAHGFDKVSNLSGGVDAWAAEIDPAMPRY